MQRPCSLCFLLCSPKTPEGVIVCSPGPTTSPLQSPPNLPWFSFSQTDLSQSFLGEKMPKYHSYLANMYPREPSVSKQFHVTSSSNHWIFAITVEREPGPLTGLFDIQETHQISQSTSEQLSSDSSTECHHARRICRSASDCIRKDLQQQGVASGRVYANRLVSFVQQSRFGARLTRPYSKYRGRGWGKEKRQTDHKSPSHFRSSQHLEYKELGVSKGGNSRSNCREIICKCSQI